MAKFKIVTQQAAGTSFGVSGGGYKLEMEGLGICDAEIVEVAAKTEEEFIAAARDADALYAKGRPITKAIIDGLERCKVIALGSVGADSVDVARGHRARHPRHERARHVHRGSGRPRDDADPGHLPPAPDDGQAACARVDGARAGRSCRASRA